MNEFIEDFKKRYETDKEYQVKVKKIGFVSVILIVSSIVFFAFNPNDKDPQATEIPKNRVTENYINSEKENFIDDKKVIYGESEENQDSIDLSIPNSQMSEQEDDLNLNEYMGKRQNMISKMNSEPTRRSYDPAPPMRRRVVSSPRSSSYDNYVTSNNPSEDFISKEDAKPQRNNPPQQPKEDNEYSYSVNRSESKSSYSNSNNDKYPELPNELIVMLESYKQVRNGQDALAYIHQDFKINGTIIPKNTPVKGKLVFAGGRIQFNPRVIITPNKRFFCNYLAYSKDGDLGFASAEEIPENEVMNKVKNDAINGINSPNAGVFSNTVESVANAFKSLATQRQNIYAKTSGVSKLLILRKPFIEF